MRIIDMTFIQTFSGKKLDLLKPNIKLICIEDIAHGLMYECRFARQCKFFYSVAQHSIYACGLAPNELKLEALLHDAAEAYLGDISKPLKNLLKSPFKNHKDYEWFEDNLQNEICYKFGLWKECCGWTGEAIRILKEIDCRLAITEERDLMRYNGLLHGNQYKGLKAYDFPILPMTFEQVYSKFMEMFELYKRN
jgi:uncharacterized protein